MCLYVSILDLKGKWLELLTPNVVEIIVHGIILGIKTQGTMSKS